MILQVIALMCAVGAMAEAEAEAQYYRPPAYPAHKAEYPQSHYPSPAPYGKPAYPAYPAHSPYPAYPSYEKYVSRFILFTWSVIIYSICSILQDYCDPKAAPKCAENSTLPWCLADSEYPTYEIKASLRTYTL